MRKYILSALALSALLYSGCKEEDNTPEPVNEEELITTVRLSFIPQGGGSTAVFQFVDLDGDGGSDPVITNDTLQDSTNYTLSIEFLNESVNPAEDITAEVVEEGTEHQIFYLLSAGLNLSISYDDMDNNGRPIGVQTSATTGSASSGDLDVILRHEPNKDGPGVANGDITNAGGETDVQVNFQVSIN